MRPHYVQLFIVSAFGLADAASTLVCNADNCLRAVRQTRTPTPPASADCSSYLSLAAAPTSTVTVTSTTTITSPTATVTKRDLELHEHNLRAVSPTIPRYATSACKSPDAYISACRCIGVTSTSQTSQAASTVTTTVTSTTIVPPAATFSLQVTYEDSSSEGNNGRQPYIGSRDSGGDTLFPSSSDPTTATFILPYNGGLYVETPIYPAARPVYFNTDASRAVLEAFDPPGGPFGGNVQAICSISSSNDFTCTGGGGVGRVWQLCDGNGRGVYYLNLVDPTGQACERSLGAISLTAILQ